MDKMLFIKDDIMIYTFMLLSIIINAGKCMLQNRYAKTFQQSGTDCLLFNIFISISALLALLIKSAFRITFTFELVLTGSAMGICSACSYYFMSLALYQGPMSYTVFVSCCAMLIPTVSGSVIWQEPVGIFSIIGIGILLIAFYIGTANQSGGKISKRWLIYCLMMFLSSGMIGVLQKIQQNSFFHKESDSFLIINFLSAAVFLTIPVIIRLVRRRPVAAKMLTATVRYAGLCGFGYAAIHYMNLYLSGALPSAFFFPVYNGAVILLTTVSGAVLFKEKLNRMQYVSIAVGVLGICLINFG